MTIDPSHVSITVSQTHGYLPGDRISYVVPDPRWWRRALHWILRRPAPVITREATIGAATVNTLDLE